MTSIGVKELIGIDSRSQSFQRQPKDSKGFICWFFHIFELISSHHTFRFLCGQVSMGRGHRHTLIFLPYTKKGLGKEKCSFRKKCYKSNTISHNFAMLIVFSCWTSRIPKDTCNIHRHNRRMFGITLFGFPQPTFLATTASKSSNSAGWAKLVTRHLSYLKLLYPHTWEANISNAHTLCEFRPDCTKFRPDCKVPSYPKSEKISKTEDMSKASSFKRGPNVHHPQEAWIRNYRF